VPALCALALVAGGAAAEDPPHSEETREAAELPLRDPMRPYEHVAVTGPAVQAPSGFELTAVLVSESRRVAVINGKLRRVGDDFDGARLVRIDAESVRLTRGGDAVVVHLNRRRSATETTQGASTR
jgi:hypothetical protein